MNLSRNRRVLLASRPTGPPTPANFRLNEAPAPEPGAGQVLLRTLYLSLDPYMRGRMNEGDSYTAPFPVGEALGGATVSRVEISHQADFAPGDIVLGTSGWQEYALSDGTGLVKLAPDMAHPSHALGVLGMTGFTAWHGLRAIGQPQAGETLVVAAASGAVGSVVGQLARLMGCRVVGIAGGEAKCRYVVEELGFDACLDRRTTDFETQFRAALPNGIDIYFENVGGPVLDAVLPLLNNHARIPVCGFIAHYNAAGNEVNTSAGPKWSAQLLSVLVMKRIRMQGFLISDHYGPEFAEFQGQMSRWVAEGKVKAPEHLIEGLENAPAAFIGLLDGENLGKVVVRVAAD